MTHPPAGCPFAPRCAYVIQTCRQVMPPLDPFAPGRERACHVAVGVVRAGHAPLPDLPEPAEAAATDLPKESADAR